MCTAIDGVVSVPKSIVAKWYLTVHDAFHKPTIILFGLGEDDSPLIIGLDLKKYFNTANLRKTPHIEFQRPTDSSK